MGDVQGARAQGLPEACLEGGEGGGPRGVWVHDGRGLLGHGAVGDALDFC